MKKTKNKNKKLHWQTLAAVLLVVIGSIGFLWVFLPPPTTTITLDLQEIRMPIGTDQYALLQQAYQLQIKTPQQVKAGKIFNYSFRLLQSQQPLNVTIQDVDIFEHYQLNLTLLPDFSNSHINPPGSMTTALLPDQEPIMQWKIDPIGKEMIEGIFWVYIDFIPLNDGLPASSTALLARNVEIPIQTIFGLTTNWVAIISSAFLVVSIFLGLPQLPLFRKENNANEQ